MVNLLNVKKLYTLRFGAAIWETKRRNEENLPLGAQERYACELSAEDLK